MNKIITYIFIITIIASCGQKITGENAIEKLLELPIHNTSYYAPMQIGRIILSAEAHYDAPQFIAKTYGKLIELNLITVDKTKENIWRTVINVELTDKGMLYCDPKKTKSDTAYVSVCYLKPIELSQIIMHSKDTIECRYISQKQNITPFGKLLGFDNDKKYETTHLFID